MYERNKSEAMAFATNVHGSLDLTQLLLSGVGALTTGGATPNILAGASTAVGGTKGVFDNTVYQRLFMPAILRKTDQDREALRGALYTHDDADPDDYSVDRMIVDVQAFHEAGSFYRGLIELAEDHSPPTTMPKSGNR